MNCKVPAMILAVFAFLAQASAGRAADKDAKRQAREFNRAMLAADKKLAEASKDLGTQLAALFAGKEVDIKAIKAAFANRTKVLTRVQADMKALKVPDSDSARAFFQAHQRFLKTQATTVSNDLKEIIQVLENQALQVTDKKAKVQSILDRMEATEGKALAEMQKAQREFARAYGIKLG